jgi:CRISPR/Cas system endoribonuclease Cas6 (RAMP superfamily)
MRDLKRHLIFSSPGCDFVASIFKGIRDLPRFKERRKALHQNHTGRCSADDSVSDYLSSTEIL